MNSGTRKIRFEPGIGSGSARPSASTTMPSPIKRVEITGSQRRLVGLAIVLLGLGLALPLPIPGSNLIFLIPLFVYAVGLLERDGIWVLLGHAGTVIDMTLLVVFGATVLLALEKAWHYLF